MRKQMNIFGCIDLIFINLKQKLIQCPKLVCIDDESGYEKTDILMPKVECDDIHFYLYTQSINYWEMKSF